MADIIEKIGRYFAEQEAQMREMHAVAAAASSAAAPTSAARRSVGLDLRTTPSPPASSSSSSTAAASALRQRARPELARRSSAGDASKAPVDRSMSLVRRRLSRPSSAGAREDGETLGQAKAPPTTATGATKEPVADKSSTDSSLPSDSIWGCWGPETDGDEPFNGPVINSDAVDRGSNNQESMGESSLASASTSSSARRQKRHVGAKKVIKKKKIKAPESEAAAVAAAAQKKAALAAEGWARAQERARRIQHERLEQEKRQEAEREETLARVHEQMMKIEEIRRRGKPFALRLRPHSAPTTPQQRTPQGSVAELDVMTSETPHADGPLPFVQGLSPPSDASAEPRFVDKVERQVHEQMMLELTINERIHKKHMQQEQEWTRLQTQIKKQTDRNGLRQGRIASLLEAKATLERELATVQNEALAFRQERHQLEEKSKKERLQRQREAERAIQARIRQEESQKLMEDERMRSDSAAVARTRAKERVQSRAALLKRVLHGCDVGATKARNQDDEASDSTRRLAVHEPAAPVAKSASLNVLAPELAEFEEDGLASGGDPTAIVAAPDEAQFAMSSREMAFRWEVPGISRALLREILLDELVSSSSSSSESDDD